MEPTRPKDAIGVLVLLALLLFVAALLFGVLGTDKQPAAGGAAVGFAIAGGLVIQAMVLLHWVHWVRREPPAKSREVSPDREGIP